MKKEIVFFPDASTSTVEKKTRITILILFCFTLFCRAGQDKASLPEMMAGLTPKGWKLYDTVQHFTAENLYKQINGRAEFYLAYNVKGMTFAGFTENRENGHYFDLSVFDMGVPANAFGVFSGERSPDDRPLDLGRMASRSGANYYIWKGKYYIRVITSEDTEKLRKTGLELAREVTAFLADSGETVWGLHALPRENRLPGSERYFLVDALGLDFMRSTYTAKYSRDDGPVVTVFLSQRESGQTASAVVKLFLEYAGRYGKGVENLTVDGKELSVCDMGGSYDVIFRWNRIVSGVSAVQDKKTAVRAAVHFWKQLELIKEESK